MPDSDSFCLSQVLTEEYQALRSDTSSAPSDPKASEPERLAQHFHTVHHQPRPFRALCISGGGIRSATFALGALQSMADHGFLREFDYLSTVSGGGYIGSWLTAWIHRLGGLDKVAPKLKRDAPKPVATEPDPIQHLRDYNNYLTPKLGLFSADTWTLVATVLRNMTLNWLVLVPLLLFALAIPRLSVSLIMLGGPYTHPATETWSWVIRITLVVSCVLFSLGVLNAMRYLPGVGNKPHTQGDFLRYVLAPLVTSYVLQCAHFWWSSDTTSFPREVAQGLIESYAGWLGYLLLYEAFQKPKTCLKHLFGPLSFAMLLVGLGVGTFSWILLTKIYFFEGIRVGHFVALGPPLLLLGFSLAASLFVGLTSRVLQDEDREWFSRAGAWLTMFTLMWAGICSLVLVLPAYALAWGTWMKSGTGLLGALSAWASSAAGFSRKSNAQTEERQPQVKSSNVELAAKLAPPVFVVLFFLGLSIFTDFVLGQAGLVPNVPQWWLHFEILESSSLIVTGVVAAVFLFVSIFASRYININLFSLNAMYRNRLIRAYLGASNPKRNASLFTGFAENDNLHMREIAPQQKPFHVLNLTLNLVSGDRLAWQQRKAESFTVSPLHCGSSDLGYRPAAGYSRAITLGGAMTISGAAASPNMGYHSSAVVGFIMTLFNARLGAWLGNPGPAGDKTWRHQGPRSATGSLVKEAFGLTNNRNPYVYLSDGGHFENLGLYEMVARRVRHILVLDASGDPKLNYEDLGNTLRKIRIDMNIPIEFDDLLIGPLQAHKKRCAVARIRYSNVDGDCEDGHLIYVKPMFLGSEPPDVASYHCAHSDFPHQTTGDQWFDESQTESYRILGMHTMDEICRHLQGDTLEDVCRAAENYIKDETLSAQAQA